MSVDKAFREMVRNEIEAQLKPLRDLVSRLEAGTSDLDSLRSVAEQLAPLASAVGPLFGVSGGARSSGGGNAPRRGAGRPARSGGSSSSTSSSSSSNSSSSSSGGKRRGRKPANVEGGARDCAIIGCGKPSRTKGYCAAHYQKLRMLEKTNRRPGEWKDYAEANSVEDIKLPRGRAAAKALAEAQKSAG